MEDFGFRTLYDDLNRDEILTFNEALLKWHPQAKAKTLVLAKYGDVAAIEWKLNHGQTIGPISYDDSWELYALSRVSDLLLLPFQRGLHNSLWYPDITLAQRSEYLLSLNMQSFSQPQFHPFYHEIVEVEQSANPSEPISIVEELWPGFMLGSMMFCRAGVRVTGGTNHIIKKIAEYSPIYFTYLRDNRRCQDLSKGWGSNSQWRTEFRRDYAINGTYYYNVEGEWDVHVLAPKYGPGKQYEPVRNGFSVDERIELLTNRCFIVSNKSDYDQWPYDDFYIQTSLESG